MIARMLTRALCGALLAALTAVAGAPASAQNGDALPQVAARALGVIETCLGRARDRAEGALCVGLASAACARTRGAPETGRTALQCLGAETSAWKALLKTQTGRVRAALPEAAREGFRRAQQDWLQLAQTDCVAWRRAALSSLAGAINQMDCLRRMTALRALDLIAVERLLADRSAPGGGSPARPPVPRRSPPAAPPAASGGPAAGEPSAGEGREQ